MRKQVREQVNARSRKWCHANESLTNEPNAQQAEEKKKQMTSFSQPTSLMARGRASATLSHGIHLCQSKCY